MQHAWADVEATDYFRTLGVAYGMRRHHAVYHESYTDSFVKVRWS